MNSDFRVSIVSIDPMIEPATGCAAEMDRLGDEIAELSAHLDAATARLLDLIHKFDARGGWGNGLADVARRARSRRGPRAGPSGARAGSAAATGPGARPR
jgi:hypothetical protein